MNQLELNLEPNNKNCGECNVKIDFWEGYEKPYYSKNRKAFICDDCMVAFEYCQEDHERMYGTPFPFGSKGAI